MEKKISSDINKILLYGKRFHISGDIDAKLDYFKANYGFIPRYTAKEVDGMVKKRSELVMPLMQELSEYIKLDERQLAERKVKAEKLRDYIIDTFK